MLTVFNLQWLRLWREPLLVIIFLAMGIGFVFFIVGTGNYETITIQTYSEELTDAEMEEWLERLNEIDVYQFEKSDRDAIEEGIRRNQIGFALELNSDGYRYLVGQESQVLMAVNQQVQKVYRTHLRINEVNELYPENPVIERDYIEIESRSLAGVISTSEEANANTLVGMTLYFSVFTIMFSIMNIAVEKRTGTWDRLIATPLRKSQIYVGQLLYILVMGVAQIGISFLIFSQLFNYTFGDQYLSILLSIIVYVFAIVALGLLIVAIVKSPQQLNAVIPIVATGSAMLGGAFWPLEIVSNNILLVLGKMTPIYHGMEALKGAILYNRGVVEILQPISILLFMGVLFMGIGLNLMERKQ